MKHVPHVGAVAIMPITAAVTSLAVRTEASCSAVHGAGKAGGSGASPHAIAHACCSAPVFDAQPMKHVPHVGAVAIMPITAAVASLALRTEASCSAVQGAAASNAGGGAGVSASGGSAVSVGGTSDGLEEPPLAHAIAQLVASAALAHPIRHCPHGGLLLISPTTADDLSAAVPTFVTSAIVQAAAGDAGFGTAVAAAGGDAAEAQAIAQLVASAALAHPIRHCPHGGLLLISPTTADDLSAAVPTFVTSAIVHDAAGNAGFGTAVAAAGGDAAEAHAIAQLVASAALAHPIRHCPHGGLLLISPTTADDLSAAVPTFVTSAIVHDAALELVRQAARRAQIAQVRKNVGRKCKECMMLRLRVGSRDCRFVHGWSEFF
jgi:predicted RNA-binding Zn ribbon-like protein